VTRFRADQGAHVGCTIMANWAATRRKADLSAGDRCAGRNTAARSVATVSACQSATTEAQSVWRHIRSLETSSDRRMLSGGRIAKIGVGLADPPYLPFGLVWEDFDTVDLRVVLNGREAY
jgi:hypothetical protein